MAADDEQWSDPLGQHGLRATLAASALSDPLAASAGAPVQRRGGGGRAADYLDEVEADPFDDFRQEYGNGRLAALVWEWSESEAEAYDTMDWLLDIPDAQAWSIRIVNQLGSALFGLYLDLLDYGLPVLDVRDLAGFGAHLDDLARACTVAELQAIAVAVPDRLLQMRIGQKMDTGLTAATLSALVAQGPFANCYQKLATAPLNLAGDEIERVVNAITPAHYVTLLAVANLGIADVHEAADFGAGQVAALSALQAPAIVDLCRKFNTAQKRQQIANLLGVASAAQYAAGPIGQSSMGKLVRAGAGAEITAAVAAMGEGIYAELLRDEMPTAIHGVRNQFAGADLAMFTETVFRMGRAPVVTRLMNGGHQLALLHALRGFGAAGFDQITAALAAPQAQALGAAIRDPLAQMRILPLLAGLSVQNLHDLTQAAGFAGILPKLTVPNLSGPKLNGAVNTLTAANVVRLLAIGEVGVALVVPLADYGLASAATLVAQTEDTLTLLHSKFNSQAKKAAILARLPIATLCAYALGPIGQGPMGKLTLAADGACITNAVALLGQARYATALQWLAPDTIRDCQDALDALQDGTLRRLLGSFRGAGLTEAQVRNLFNHLLTGANALDEAGLLDLVDTRLEYLTSFAHKRDMVMKVKNDGNPGSTATRVGFVHDALEVRHGHAPDPILTVPQREAFAIALSKGNITRQPNRIRDFITDNLRPLGAGARLALLSKVDKFAEDWARNYAYAEQNVAYHLDNVVHTVNATVNVGGVATPIAIRVVEQRRNHIVSGHTFKYYNFQGGNIDRSNVSSMFAKGTGLADIVTLIDANVPGAVAGINFTPAGNENQVNGAGNVALRRSGGVYYLTRFYLNQDSCTNNEITMIRPLFT